MKEITVDRIVKLDAGGYLVVWHEPESSQRHNTFTRDPAKWVEGYRQGQTLDQLQAITEPQSQGS